MLLVMDQEGQNCTLWNHLVDVESCLLIVDVFPGMDQLIHCHWCGKGFNNAQVLKVHIRDVHENKGKVYNCEVCNKESRSLNGLRRHMSVYHRNHNSSSTFINC